ncbi:MAG: cysteine desulfurase [Candidatus Micrarchaeota archaeon]|nr:cysteine desulfurase [Candidatus Micrarchaeota archaeon]
MKKDFPILERKINGHDFVYLDSAATSQKPRQVIEAMNDYYTNYNANVHRGVYKISEEASEKYDDARSKVKNFINASSEQEIIYTKGTTESINLVMRSWGEKFIKKGDKIVTTIMEHHSNFVPWQQLASKTGAIFEVVGINKNYELDESELERKIKGAKLVAVTHASNVLGTINPVEKICKIAHDNDAVVLVDGAQSIPHFPVDVRKIDCDFFAFSGHKMLGPTGIGVLYGKKELLESMDPFNYGGDMISEVHVDKSEWNKLPYKFEAGTPPIAEVIGLGAAISYLEKIGMKKIREHEKELTNYAIEMLSKIKNCKIIGSVDVDKRLGAITFDIAGIHPHDLASLLNEKGIAIRTGHHCAMPLHEYLKLNATARASFYIYNEKKDVDALVDSINYAKKIFGVK